MKSISIHVGFFFWPTLAGPPIVRPFSLSFYWVLLVPWVLCISNNKKKQKARPYRLYIKLCSPCVSLPPFTNQAAAHASSPSPGEAALLLPVSTSPPPSKHPPAPAHPRCPHNNRTPTSAPPSPTDPPRKPPQTYRGIPPPASIPEHDTHPCARTPPPTGSPADRMTRAIRRRGCAAHSMRPSFAGTCC